MSLQVFAGALTDIVKVDDYAVFIPFIDRSVRIVVRIVGINIFVQGIIGIGIAEVKFEEIFERKRRVCTLLPYLLGRALSPSYVY